MSEARFSLVLLLSQGVGGGASGSLLPCKQTLRTLVRLPGRYPYRTEFRETITITRLDCRATMRRRAGVGHPLQDSTSCGRLWINFLTGTIYETRPPLPPDSPRLSCKHQNHSCERVEPTRGWRLCCRCGRPGWVSPANIS